ncbi:MAG: CRISPR-associated endonuclease Cas1 [Bacteroidaceae bacterium]|nr:CRISPR-associated endonuclease Cas1 [Bacteroidaceae bacterium]
MSKQTIVIESAKELSLSDGMIVIKDKESEEIILRPIEDVQMVMIDHHSARVTTPLITRLAKNNASVIYCDETHMPVSMTMDLDSNTIQSKRFQYQLSASAFSNDIKPSVNSLKVKRKDAVNN